MQPHQILLNESEIEYARELANQKSAESGQKLEAAFTGILGKICAEKFLAEYNWEIDSKFREQNNLAGCDLKISHLQITVRTWKEENWEEWGRCIPTEQKFSLPQNSDLIIWVTINSRDKNVALGSIQGFNWTTQISAWPEKQTGPSSETKENVQGPSEAVISTDQLPLRVNNGPRKPLPIPAIIATNNDLSVGQRFRLQNLAFRIVDPREIKLCLALQAPSQDLTQSLVDSYNSLKINGVDAGLLLANLRSILSPLQLHAVENELAKFDRITSKIARGETSLLVASLDKRDTINSTQLEWREPCENCQNNAKFGQYIAASCEEKRESICNCCGVKFPAATPPPHVHQKIDCFQIVSKEKSESQKIAFANVFSPEDLTELSRLGAEIWSVPRESKFLDESRNSQDAKTLMDSEDRSDGRCANNRAKAFLVEEKFDDLHASFISDFADKTGLTPSNIYQAFEDIADDLAEHELGNFQKCSSTAADEARKFRDRLRGRYLQIFKRTFSVDQIVATHCLNQSGSEFKNETFIYGIDSEPLLKALDNFLPLEVKKLEIVSNSFIARLGTRDWIENYEYVVGDQIEHEAFGRGTVLRTFARDDVQRIEVTFQDSSTRTLKSPDFSYSLVRT